MSVSDAAPIVQRKPRAIELVGVAGAGKTTLASELAGLDSTIVTELPLSRSDLLRELCHAAPLLAATVRDYRGGRWFSRGEIRSLLYLRAWRRRLTEGAFSKDTDTATLLLDHGPIYRLAWLTEFGPTVARGEAFQAWWQQALQQWAATLDAVIWLNAPSDVLLQRIRNRSQAHLVKQRSERQAYRFLQRYDVTYQQIIGEMEACSGLRVLRVNSDSGPPERLAAEVLAALDDISSDAMPLGNN